MTDKAMTAVERAAFLDGIERRLWPADDAVSMLKCGDLRTLLTLSRQSVGVEEMRPEDVRLAGSIKWKSDDRDNMEFVTRASCFQVEALKRILSRLTGEL